MTALRSSKSILVIEDDDVLNRLLASELTAMGFHALSARTWAEAEIIANRQGPDLVLLDIRLPDADGLEIVPQLAKSIPVIVLTAFGTIEQAVDAMRAGALEYLTKPVNIEELELTLKRAFDTLDLKHSVQILRSRQQKRGQPFMVGASPALGQVTNLIRAVAEASTTVLIQGESGVGKELVARQIHDLSDRNGANFVALDCCTLQENLFESELFGHERGAFTGAAKQKKGLIEGAAGGTLFLDELGEVMPSIQAKLLRVIETGEFRRLGGVRDLTSDARIVAATNRNLETMVQAGEFRDDLYYRLTTFVITVPPLRDRIEDVPTIARHFLANHDFSRRIFKELSPATDQVLTNYHWPGNVRELRNVVERAVILSGDLPVIEPDHLGLTVNSRAAPETATAEFQIDGEPTLEELKKSYVLGMVERYHGHRTTIAEKLGVSERNLYRMLARYGVK